MKLVTAVVFLIALQVVCGANVALRLKQVPGSSVPPASQSISSYLQSVGSSALQQSNAALSAALAQSAASASASAADSIPATPLNNPGSAAATSAAGSCAAPSPCQNPISWGNGASSDSDDSGMSVSDAVKPIEEWIKDFKARTGSDGADLMSAARATVSPMLEKLKRNQQDALDKLEDSNAAILSHVEEAATEHVYNLLRAQKISDDSSASKAAQQEKIAEIKAEAAEKEAESKLLTEHSEHSGEHSESSSHSTSEHSESSHKL